MDSAAGAPLEEIRYQAQKEVETNYLIMTDFAFPWSVANKLSWAEKSPAFMEHTPNPGYREEGYFS